MVFGDTAFAACPCWECIVVVFAACFNLYKGLTVCIGNANPGFIAPGLIGFTDTITHHGSDIFIYIQQGYPATFPGRYAPLLQQVFQRMPMTPPRRPTNLTPLAKTHRDGGRFWQVGLEAFATDGRYL
jgi:hypothetical protein